MDLFGEPEAPAEAQASPSEPYEAPPLEVKVPEVIQGHEAAELQLLDLFQSGRLPHALVFHGPKGVGKSLIAKRFATFLLKNGKPEEGALFDEAPARHTNLDVPGDDPVIHLMASGAHPDFKLIVPDDSDKKKTTINLSVAEIRKVSSFMRMKASDGGWRVVIVDDADTMNRNAQNALLKILEEPPENALLILVTHRLGSLIPTIRSRVQLVPFSPLNNEIMSTLLKENTETLSMRDMALLSNLSNGSIGNALSFVEADVLTTMRRALEIMDDYPTCKFSSVHSIANDVGTSREGYSAFKLVWTWMFERLTKIKARGPEGQIDDVFVEGPFQDILKNSSLEQLAKICENLHSHFEKVEAGNLDKKQAVLEAVSVVSR